MRNLLVLLSITGLCACATTNPDSGPTDTDMLDDSRSRGISERYYLASDLDPDEYSALNQRQRYQRFDAGCALDFYSIVGTAEEPQRWKLREDTMLSGYLGTYRRFVSDSAFEQGKDHITPSLGQDLDWFAAEFRRSPLMPYVLVIGHTNSDGGDDYNQRLSEARAQQVVTFLTEAGIPGERIHSFGVGETSPRVSLNPEASHALNRRVELVTFIPSGGTRPGESILPCREDPAFASTEIVMGDVK